MNTDELTTDKLMELFHNFNNDPYILEFRERDKTYSQMEIYGVSRLEGSHSAFLAWLFDSDSDHNLGTIPITKLMLLLQRRHTGSMTESDNDISDAELYSFQTGNYRIISSKCHPEFVNGNKNNRPDIVIDINAKSKDNKDSNIRIVFENKLCATETLDKDNVGQTIRYYKEYSSKKDGYRYIYVYNTCNDQHDPADSKHFIHIYYQEIVDQIIEPLLKVPGINTRTKDIFKDYLLALEKPANEDIKKNKKTIMAISTEQKELLKQFWDNNVDIIEMAAEILGKDEIASAISSSKNSYKFTFSKEKYNSLGDAGKALIEYLINTVSFKDLDDLCDRLEITSYHPKLLVYSKDVETKDDHRFHPKQEILNEDVRIHKGWDGTDSGNFDKFVNKVKALCGNNWPNDVKKETKKGQTTFTKKY